MTDVPCMKLVKVNGGYSIAVYQPGERKQVEELLKHQRLTVPPRPPELSPYNGVKWFSKKE